MAVYKELYLDSRDNIDPLIPCPQNEGVITFNTLNVLIPYQITQIALLECTFPNNFSNVYTNAETYGSTATLTLSEDDGFGVFTTITFTMTEGRYTPTTFAAQLQADLITNSPFGRNYVVVYNTTTLKITITCLVDFTILAPSFISPTDLLGAVRGVIYGPATTITMPNASSSTNTDSVYISMKGPTTTDFYYDNKIIKSRYIFPQVARHCTIGKIQVPNDTTVTPTVIYQSGSNPAFMDIKAIQNIPLFRYRFYISRFIEFDGTSFDTYQHIIFPNATDYWTMTIGVWCNSLNTADTTM